MRYLKSLLEDEEGASVVEYGLLLALLAIACIIAAAALSNSVVVACQDLSKSI
jgi:Flp pilus assembly pilin Flp